MVAPDYVGMGTTGPTPYLIGTGEAYSALDAARAAHQLSGLSLSDQTVVWGHSQGGGAALWTGHLAASYAPSLKLDGVAALARATDLIPLARSVEHAAAGTVVTGYVITDYSNTYKDVRFDDYVRPGARVQVRTAAKRCLTDPGLAASLIAASGGESIFSRDLASGPLGARLRQNTPTADVGGAPLLVAQGTGDEVIDISIAEKWVADQCAAGYNLDFIKYPNLTHMGLLDTTSPLTDDLTNWTIDRFAGKPAPNSC
jgi:pimeloyl-ACP methyl ester carboxylesterase